MSEKTRVLENMLEIIKAELATLLEIAEIHNIPKDIVEKQVNSYLEDIFKIKQEIEKLNL